MKVIGYGQTDVGNKRTTNEDFFVVDSDLGLFIVCDGVSGHASGDVASTTTVQIVHQYIRTNRAIIDRYASDASIVNRNAVDKVVEAAVNAACAEIYRMAQDDESKRGMATTIVMFLKAGNNALIAHVGDSRAYTVRAGAAHQITEDHSLLAEEIRKGTIQPHEADRFRSANVITRSVGFQEAAQVDILHFELNQGDLYLLCTDGLSDYLKLTDLADFAKKAKPANLPKEMVAFAKSKGGKDNITNIVVHVEKADAIHPDLDVISKTETIQKIPLFRYLTYQELMKVLAVASVRTYKPGEPVIVENSLGTEMFVILSGSVELLKMGHKLTTLKSGAFFGEMGLIDNAPRSASIVASEPTKVIVITRVEFYPLLRKEPQLAVKLLWSFCQSLNGRLRSTTELLADVKADLESMKPEVPFVMGKE